MTHIVRSTPPVFAICRPWPSIGRLLALVALALLPVAATHGAQIDVSLNLFYDDTTDPTSGGTWTLSAKTDEFGLVNLNVQLQGIAPGVTLLAPTGAVNGTEPAGFHMVQATHAGYTDLAAFQIPSRDGEGEERVFYGVGSIINPQGAAPNWPGQPAGTMSIGPELTTLSNVQQGVWGTGDELGDGQWDHAAVLLAGTFLPGSSPDFFITDTLMPNGTVFLDTGTLQTAGAHSDPAATIVTSIVRSDLEFRGDYNLDGVVDAADYTVWRNTLGDTVQPLEGADGSGNGLVDADDFEIWKNFFGRTAPAPGGLAAPITAVPEPSSALFATFFVAMASAAVRVRFRLFAREARGQERNFEKMLYSGETA